MTAGLGLVAGIVREVSSSGQTSLVGLCPPLKDRRARDCRRLRVKLGWARCASSKSSGSLG